MQCAPIECDEAEPHMKELNWKFIRAALKTRRFARTMEKNGFKKHETDWEIIRGSDDKRRMEILEAVIDVDRKHVWTRVGHKDEQTEG